MANYHINENTGRPNRCTAEKRPCPVGGEHYTSKEDAIEGIQKAAAEENDTFTKLKKDSTRGAKTPKTPSTGQLFRKLLAIDPDTVTPQQIQADFVSELREYADYENPGCAGCDGSGDDYCRCRTYTGQVSFTPHEIAVQFFNLHSKYRSNRWGYSHLEEEEKKVVDELISMFEEHGLNDIHNYETESSMDYYGEEIERIVVNDPSRFVTFRDRLVETLTQDKEE